MAVSCRSNEKVMSCIDLELMTCPSWQITGSCFSV